MKALLGFKTKMTNIFDKNGIAVPITIIKVFENYIIDSSLKNKKKNYNFLQLGTLKTTEKRISKAVLHHLKKNNVDFPLHFIREIRDFDLSLVTDKKVLTVDLFSAGEYVDVQGHTKGKGFSGSIQRHNFHRGPMSHGSQYHRGVGSLGPIAPKRVAKQKKMPGRDGNLLITMKNLPIVAVDKTNNCLLVKGSIPGPNKSFVIVKESVYKKNKKYSIDLNVVSLSKEKLETKVENKDIKK